MDRTDGFFIPENEIRLPHELDYTRVGEYIDCAEAFSRSSYQSVYIIDYFKRNFGSSRNYGAYVKIERLEC